MPPHPIPMSVIEIAEPGGPDVLKPARRDRPVSGLGQILVKVQAAGVNRGDVVQRMGFYPPPPGASDIPGLEVAGEVAELGPEVQGWKVGDAVCAIVPGGGYAEYAVVDAAVALPVPKGISMVEAACLPEAAMTVWTNVFDRARLRSGEDFLLHGGASGIGTIGIQMAEAFGARVFATAGTPEKCTLCEALGATRAINYRAEDFVEIVRTATQGKGADVILDMVGGEYVARNIKTLALEGRLVNIAFQAGAKVTLDLMPVMLKRLTLTGSTLRARAVPEKAAIAKAVRENVWPLIEAGKIRPVLDSTFPLARAADAHRKMEASIHTGKIVLTVGD